MDFTNANCNCNRNNEHYSISTINAHFVLLIISVEGVNCFAVLILSKQGEVLDRQHLMSASIRSLFRGFVFIVTVAENPTSQRYVDGEGISMVNACIERMGKSSCPFAQNVGSSSPVKLT